MVMTDWVVRKYDVTTGGVTRCWPWGWRWKSVSDTLPHVFLPICVSRRDNIVDVPLQRLGIPGGPSCQLPDHRLRWGWGPLKREQFKTKYCEHPCLMGLFSLPRTVFIRDTHDAFNHNQNESRCGRNITRNESRYGMSPYLLKGSAHTGIRRTRGWYVPHGHM